MATKTPSKSPSRQHRSATIQWLAIGVVVALGIIAAFVFFGDSGGVGGGHLGLGAPSGFVPPAS